MNCRDLDELYKRAGYACEICRRREPTGDPLNIDHEPYLGDYAVRGLLCRGCNGRIGADGGVAFEEADVQRYLINAWWARPGGPRPLGRPHFAQGPGSRTMHIVSSGIRLIGNKPERTLCEQQLPIAFGVHLYQVEDDLICGDCVSQNDLELRRLWYYRRHPLAFKF